MRQHEITEPLEILQEDTVAQATKELFQEVRSILNGEKTEQGWKSLLQRLGYTFKYVYDTGGDEKPNGAQHRILEEVFPYIRQELDANWPDEVRVVSIDHHARLQELGKILSISFFGSGMQQFGALFGKKYNTAISKKQIREMLPKWIRAEAHNFEGLILGHVDKYHDYLLEQLLEANFEGLRYVRFTDLSAPMKKGTYGYEVTAYTEMTNKLIDLRGETLESFGGGFSGRTSIPELYGPLLERAEELPELRWLCFTHPLYADDEDLFAEFMKHPHYDKVDTLTFPGGLSIDRANILINREASKNLERIGVGYFGYYSLSFDLRQLIDDKNMVNVNVWDVREESRDIDCFESKQARGWRDYKQGVERNDLGRRVVDLMSYDRERTHEALFGKDGNLLPAPEMRALRIQNISKKDLDVVIDHGHEVWPDLECLVFQFCPYEDVYDEDIAFLERWNSSPWLAQLTFLGWDESIYHPYGCAISQHRGRSKEREFEELEKHFDMLLENTLHPHLAQHAWNALSSQISRKPDASKLAKKVGITGYSKLDRYEIAGQIRVYLHETLGWEGKLLDKGPTYACHSWTKEFEW